MRHLDFRGLVDAAPDVIAVFDREHRYVYVNAALERVIGLPAEALIGRRHDEVMAPPEAAVWREALDDVLHHGAERTIESTLDTPRGQRRFAALISRLPGDLLCFVSRDVTDVGHDRLLEIAAHTMSTGMVIVEGPSGRTLFKNEEASRILGEPSQLVRSVRDYDAVVAFDEQGERLMSDRWPIVRALRGEAVVAERVEVQRDDGGRRVISINASPVRGPGGQIIAAVSTYYDVTEARRAHVAARYLAEASALLERLDPSASLQAIVDLAVPVLADWCFVNLATGDGPILATIAHADPEQAAATRARTIGPLRMSPDAAVARVLAGGPREIFDVDDAALQKVAKDAGHLEQLRRQGFRSAVVAPLSGHDGVLGALTFVMAGSGRRYDAADLEMLGELARRTGIALDNARLFAAEKEARRHAEEARDRTRRLQQLTAALSGVVEEHQVTSIMVDAGRDALGASAGFAWLLHGDDGPSLAAFGDASEAGRTEQFRTMPMAAPLPVCDVIRTGEPMLFESVAAMTSRYPKALPPGRSPFRAWAVMPFVVGGRGVGAVSFSFDHERKFSDEDRELLVAMIGQASLALERCMLIEAERRARADAEAARVRERRLHNLAARLSSALTPQQVAVIACEDAVVALGAFAGATSVRDGDEIRILGVAGPHDPEVLARSSRMPIDSASPHAEAVRKTEAVWCANEAELMARYPHLEAVWRPRGVRAWGTIPFTFEGRAVGSLSVSFLEERRLSAEETEFLHAVGQLTAQALERARLYEALHRSEEQLRVALTAGRTATWSVDLTTMKSTRDPSYVTLLGLEGGQGDADFQEVHPDDRAIAMASFARALRDGAPYDPEVRLRRGDGSYMWIRSHGRVMYGPDGEPTTIAGVMVDIDEAKRASLRADEERRINETLYRLGSSFASELHHDRLVQLISDEITKLIGAEQGAFFGAVGADETLLLEAVSSRGVDRGRALSRPGVTPLLARTILAREVVRLDDVLAEPGYSAAGGPTAGHASVRSYLAVPVVASSGEVFGGLLFGHPEVGRFTAAHERLAASIASQAAVALENARLYKTVREQKDQLEVAVERARLADRRKDEFLAMLGHELRNPLAPIVTALELMSLKGAGALKKERDVIRRQVEHLARLIDDLLDVSRITRQKIQLSKQVIEVGAVLTKALEMASPLLEKRMQPLSVDVPLEGLAVDADPIRLAQVFQNLLTNAAKYSDVASPIALRARAQGGSVVVEIEDKGMGIPQELLPRLFELFVQGERALDRSQGGLGIGLTIAKSLCELHGGAISATSDGPGRGSTFIVTLPRTTPTDLPVSSRVPERVFHGPTGMRVLVVDDNVDAAQTLHEFLSTLGHESAVAHDGAAALELAGTFNPDVAVLDIGLPVMDGYELARRLREQRGREGLRLIAVTGYGQEADRARAREAGFDYHLIKPIAFDALMPLLAARTKAQTAR